jgi:hypothetical protein
MPLDLVPGSKHFDPPATKIQAPGLSEAPGTPPGPQPTPQAPGPPPRPQPQPQQAPRECLESWPDLAAGAWTGRAPAGVKHPRTTERVRSCRSSNQHWSRALWND